MHPKHDDALHCWNLEFVHIWSAFVLFEVLLSYLKCFGFYLIASRFHFDLGIIREVEVHQVVIYYSKATCLLSIIIWNGSPFDLIYYHIIIFIIQGKEQTACLQSAMQGTLWFHYCQTNICFSSLSFTYFAIWRGACSTLLSMSSPTQHTSLPPHCKKLCLKGWSWPSVFSFWSLLGSDQSFLGK